MNYALVFSGQGGQHPDMLPWLETHALLQATCARLGALDWRARLAEPAWSEVNRHAQLLLTGTSLAAWSTLSTHLPMPQAVAGYSVGELAAFSVAGVIDAHTALALAEQRAAAMDACATDLPAGLSGITGMAPPELEALCAQTGVAVAIRNGADSAVVGGPIARLAEAEAAAEAQGARCTRLKVAVASHTPWMREARVSFAQVLVATPMAPPHTLLFSNADGAIRSAEAARSALAAQIDQTVRWDRCMDALCARRVRCVLEIGAGSALARLWNQHCPEVPARSADEFRTPQAVARWVMSQQA